MEDNQLNRLLERAEAQRRSEAGYEQDYDKRHNTSFVDEETEDEELYYDDEDAYDDEESSYDALDPDEEYYADDDESDEYDEDEDSEYYEDEDEYEEYLDEDRYDSEPIEAPRPTSSTVDEVFTFDKLKGLRMDWILFTAWSIILILLASYWNTHYNIQLRNLDAKEKELVDLRYRMLYTTAELVRLERINSIEQSIQDMSLNLEHSTQPPYEVIDTTSNKTN